jgi:ASF1 like histone chaperone
LQRTILADKPRVTKFQIEWDKPEEAPTAGEPDEALQGEFLDQGYSLSPPPVFSEGFESLQNASVDMET